MAGIGIVGIGFMRMIHYRNEVIFWNRLVFGFFRLISTRT
jgi:hypothetical protein